MSSGLLFLLILAAPPTTSTTAATRLGARGQGAALAWEFSGKLRSRVVTPDAVVAAVVALSVQDRRQFLGAWEMAAPLLPAAVAIRSSVQRSIEMEPAEMEESEPGQPQLDPSISPPPLWLPERPLAQEVQEIQGEAKSVFTAWALSFFLGFGIGNYYTGDYAWGVLAAVFQAVGISLVAIGFDDPHAGFFFGVGGALWLTAWCADWGGAIYHASGGAERPTVAPRSVYAPEASTGSPIAAFAIPLVSGRF